MLYRLGADVIVVLHLAFILFVVAGGFLAWRWKWIAVAHLPAAIWGALIELFHWVCPLTPLENEMRRRAGEVGYEGGFIEHYITPIIYPSGLTTTIQVVLGIFVILVNAVAYWGVVRRWRTPNPTAR